MRTFLRRLARDTDAASTIFFGLALTTLMGTSALAVDFGSMVLAKRRLQGITDAAVLSALGSDAGGQVEPQCEVGLATLLHPALERSQHLQIEAAAAALVGECGIGEAVAQHVRARAKGRLDARDEVVAPGGEHQQRLGHRVHRPVQHEIAQGLGQLGAARLSRHDHLLPARAQPQRQRLDVRRLSGAVDALESDEAAAHGAPRW